MLTTVERLRQQASRSPSGCLEWQGAATPAGYGALRVGGRVEYAHRQAWKEANGDIPPGVFVCHTCDNRRCIAAEHLFLGTAADNNADMVRKGRHGFTKVSDLQVAEIRRRYEEGSRFPSRASARSLAEEFRISPGHVYAIVKGAVRV